MPTKRTAKKTAAKKRGRPRKIADAASRAAVLAHIVEGGTLKDACIAEGIDPDTLWREGNRDEAFCGALTRARADQRLVLSKRIYGASDERQKETETFPGDWRSAVEYLARQHPEDWSPPQKQQLEHSGKDGAPLAISIVPRPEDNGKPGKNGDN